MSNLHRDHTERKLLTGRVNVENESQSEIGGNPDLEILRVDTCNEPTAGLSDEYSYTDPV